MERPPRKSASQVWRIWPLFELFLDNLALVWLFCREFLSSLEIFSRFLEIFSRFMKIFSRFVEIFVADLRVSGQGTLRKAGKRAAP